MEELQKILLNFSEYHRYLVLAFVSFFSSMGVLPTTTDIVLFTTSALISLKATALFPSIFICLICILSGETIMFFIGNCYGEKVLSKKIFKKLTEKSIFKKMKETLLENQTAVARSVRFTPAYRPWFLLLLASMGLDKKTFFINHIPLSLIYIPSAIIVPYYLSEWLALDIFGLMILLAAFWLVTIFFSRKNS